ncbi:MAG: type III-B CRISPR module RAMP protein Cmr6 [Myxococcales bacterium]|nr:type III-B CRISPR module RAMP protein Cmr6 [Myxococcales bacterium]
MVELTLPSQLRDRALRVPLSERHPGLQLDKYSAPSDQEGQREPLLEVCGAARSPELLAQLAHRRRAARDASPGRREVFNASTVSPLTLHLARTSALENVGLCLHPIYGFAYLPAAGLKGMTRAWATTRWLPLQSDRAAAERTLAEVFGWAPGAASSRQPAGAHAGAVCFHDAMPLSWPVLQLDISNNHHAAYYEQAQPPGDWDAPNPITFLTVQPGASFELELTARDALAGGDALALAREWLVAALTQLGAGAKTSTGYGVFRVDGSVVPPLPATRARRELEVELVTPAFLAGALQREADCTLRAATLRGLLRWWWRTMHVGHLSTEVLRDLEATLWGDTRQGAAIRVEATPAARAPSVAPFEREDIIADVGLPRPPDRKTSQGLTYHSYGMDEVRRGSRQRRFMVEPGARWTIVLSARTVDGIGRLEGTTITATDALGQAHAALSLLCSLGGVGSKARKGFGNLVLTGDALGRHECVARSAALRDTLRAGGARRTGDLAPNDLDTVIELGPIATPWTDVWYALDAIGTAAQAFAKTYKHRREKLALGLPRSIHRRPQDERLSVTQGRERIERHASPIHYRIDRAADGALVVRATMFPSPILPDLTRSVAMLTELRESLQRTLTAAIAGWRPPPPGRGDRGAAASGTARSGPLRGGGARGSATPAAPAAPPVPSLQGTTVKVRLVDERKPPKQKNKKWFVETLDGAVRGFIENSGQVRGGKPGDELSVHVKSQHGAEAIFEKR